MMNLRSDKTTINSLKICPLTSGLCNKDITVDPKKVFLAEPYCDENKDKREKAINEIFVELGLELVIAVHKNKVRAFFCKICEQIQSSFLCLVDLTKLRPNVLIELGMAYGFQKPIIIIFEEKDSVKVEEVLSDINWADPIKYKDCDDLKDKLKKTVKLLFKEYGSTNLRLYDKDQIKKFKEELKLWLDLEKLEDVPNIVSFKSVEGHKRVILDQGKHNLRRGMFFCIHKVQNGIESENSFGTVEIVHPQENMSQAKINYTNFEYMQEIDDLLIKDVDPKEIPFVLKKYDLGLDKTKLKKMTKIVECLGI